MIQVTPKLRKKRRGEPVYTGNSLGVRKVSSASVCEALDSFRTKSNLTQEVEKLKELWKI